MCCNFLLADALLELPSLPSLDSDIPSVGSSSKSSDSVSTAKKSKKEVFATPEARVNVIDTQMLDAQGKDLSGSWWKKRHWLLKAREQQEKANNLVAQIQALGLPSYDSKRASFNKDVTSFYEKIGMERGKVDALLDELSPYFYPAGKEAEGQLVTTGSSYLASSKKFQDYFDATVMVAQLKADLKGVADLSAGVGERVAQYEKTCQDVVQKAAEAQSTINEMFALVNHDVARDLYYKLEGIVTYLEAVLKFVKTDLAADLDRVIALAKTKMDDVSKIVVTARTACEKIKDVAETAEASQDLLDENKDTAVASDTLDDDDVLADIASDQKTEQITGLWGRIKVFLMSLV